MCLQILSALLYEAFSFGAKQQTVLDKFEVHNLTILSQKLASYSYLICSNSKILFLNILYHCQFLIANYLRFNVLLWNVTFVP